MVKQEIVEKLAEAGVDTLKVGIQASTDHIRNNIYRRPGKNSEIIEVAKLIAKYNITARYDLILDSPYEDEHSLKEGINLMLQLPKPITFNLYSLQYFPDYPLTEMALKDGYIKPEDLSIEKLMETNFQNWAFYPKLFPMTRKQLFQNILWLIAWGHAGDGIVQYSVFGNYFWSNFSPGPKTQLTLSNK